MAKRLVARGHRVTLITSFRENSEQKSWFTTLEDGIEIHWLPVPYSNEFTYPQRIKAFLRFAYQSSRRAAKLPGDIIFATSTPLTIAIPAIYAATFSKRPFVFEVRDVWPDIPVALGAIRNPVLVAAAKWLERLAYRRARKIVALSPGMSSSIASKGIPPEKIVTIPNGCDLELFAPKQQPPPCLRELNDAIGPGPIVLYPGTLGRINGVSYMAKLAFACKQLDSPIQFVAMGEGVELPKVRNLAEELGVLNRNFFIVPPLAKQLVPAAFQEAAMIASWTIDLPVLEHNSANKFFDGLAASKPVLINYGGWQEELLHKHEAGLRLSRDPDIAARQLVQLFADPEGIVKMGQNARRLAEDQFSRDDLASALENTLSEALSTRAPD